MSQWGLKGKWRGSVFANKKNCAQRTFAAVLGRRADDRGPLPNKLLLLLLKLARRRHAAAEGQPVVWEMGMVERISAGARFRPAAQRSAQSIRRSLARVGEPQTVTWTTVRAARKTARWMHGGTCYP